MKKIISFKFFFLSALLLFLMNSVITSQNLLTNGSFAIVDPIFGSNNSCIRNLTNPNSNPGSPQVPNWTALDTDPPCIGSTGITANEPTVVRFKSVTPCLQPMGSANSNSDDHYLLLQNIFLGNVHLCDDRARQNFSQPLGQGNYTLSLSHRFQPENVATAKVGSPAQSPNNSSTLEVILLASTTDCDGTVIATIPIDANAPDMWLPFTQGFQVNAGQSSSTVVFRLTGVGTGQRSHVFLDELSIVELPNCQKNSPLYLQGTTTWTGTRFLNRDVVLVGGATLNINGGQVNFANTCGIYVASGVTLNVSNATLTNYCGGQWTGIISNGTNSNVTLTNSRIEHAVDGLRRQSGTVVAENTVFINNRRDVEYTDKSAAQTDFFRRCTFSVDDNYRGQIIRSRVTIWNSENVNFLGCTFTNAYGNPDDLSFNPNFEWQGIYAVESGFFVDNFNEATPSRFERFSVGIRIANISVNRTAQIKNSRFVDNKTGIISENVNSIAVQRNRFSVNWGGNTFPSDFNEWYKVGLVINTGTDYSVRNNDFVGDANGSGQYTFGAQLIRTGSADNKTEGNRFTNLYQAFTVVGRNTSGNDIPWTGLQMQCSENFQNVYDQVIETDGDPNSGIRILQGNNNNPDGNRFSNNSATVPDIWSNTIAYTRFFQNTLPNTLANPVVGLVNQTGVSSTPGCTPHAAFMRINNNATASNEPIASSLSAAELSQLSDDYEEVDAALQKAKKQYTDLIDGGNQGQLIANIRTRWNGDSATLRRNLSTFSPNLSAETFIVVARLNLLSKSTLMQLLKANSSSCRSHKLTKVLKEELNSPFSDADIQSVLAASMRGSQRFDVEDAINTYSSKRSDIARSLINGMIGDEPTNREQLRYWWKRIGTQTALYSLAESYIKDNQSNSYQAQLRNLSRDLSEFELQVKENDDYVDLYDVKSKVLKSGRSWKDMTRAEIEKVRRIANNTRAEAAVQANNILCYAFGECKPLIIPRIGDRLIDSPEPTAALMSSAKTNNQFVVYPNPARNAINVNYNLVDKFEEAYISLFDFTGREIKRQKLVANQSQMQWQTDDMQAGLYLIAIYADNRLVWKTKVSIQK